jgi:Protein of unknown function (DUF3987)
MPLAPGKTNELEPRPLPLSGRAKVLFVRFHDQVERDIADGGDLEPIRSFGSKLAEHAVRFAAELATVDDIYCSEITERYMEAGIVLGEYYATEALRLYGASCANIDLTLARKLLAWLVTQWPEALISTPDIYQRGPYMIRDHRTAQKLVSMLEGHGELIKNNGSAIVCGVRRRDVWKIVRWRPGHEAVS